MKPDLMKDARYQSFADRYAGDMLAFATEVCGIDVSTVQAGVFGCMVSTGRAVMGHMSGMSEEDKVPTTFAAVALWHLLAFHKSNTYITFPRWTRWREVLAPALVRVLADIQRGPHGWLVQYVVRTETVIYIAGRRHDWFIQARTANEHSPENLAGTWGPNLLWALFESHEIPDACLRVIEASLHENDRSLSSFAVSHSPKAKPTQGAPAMPEHQQRVIAEKAENDDRLTKLRAFLGTALFAALDEAEKSRLRLQADIMDLLSRVLGERIAAF